MNNISKKTILVVDDEDDVRNYLKTALEDAGFKVVTASDGFEALDQVQKEKPDLVSLDLVMPRRSGAKFYRDMQKNPEWKTIPILIVTGHARDDLGKADFDELTMSGPGVYLEKPVKPKSYVSAVRQLLGMEPSEEQAANNKADLRQQLAEEALKADPDAVRRALEALKKKDQ